jgi:hypothetical protein
MDVLTGCRSTRRFCTSSHLSFYLFPFTLVLPSAGYYSHTPSSSINLLHPRYPTPSVTTIRSLPSEATDTPSGTASPSSPRLLPVLSESELLMSQLSLNHRSSLSSLPKCFANVTSGEEASDCTEDRSGYVDLNLSSPGWLDLYVSLERSSSNSAATKTFSTASVNRPSSMIGKNHHRLDLNTLAVGEEIVLPSPINPSADVSTGTEMNVILTYPRMDPVLLKFLWHGQAKAPGEGRQALSAPMDLPSLYE